MRRLVLSAALASALAIAPAFAPAFAPAWAQEKTLRIAMTASDIPTTTGMPNTGFEGMRFLGFPIFEGLIVFDLTKSDSLATLRPGLAESWKQADDDKKTWIFTLRKGVKFHDGTDFNVDAVIWNLERIFNKDSAQFEPAATGIMRSRVPILASYFPWMVPHMLNASPASWEKAGQDWGKVGAVGAAGTGQVRLRRQPEDCPRVGHRHAAVDPRQRR